MYRCAPNVILLPVGYVFSVFPPFLKTQSILVLRLPANNKIQGKYDMYFKHLGERQDTV